MEVLEFPNGICAKHGPKLNVNGISQCVKCVADAERASKAPAPVVNVEDPGHEAMGSIKGAPAANLTRAGEPNKPAIGSSKAVIVPAGLTAIREAIYRLPMPKSLKQYKRFQKIQQLIDQALEDENGEAD